MAGTRSATGERQIPAVRAPDGTLIYLVQPETGGRSFWEDDFALLPAIGEPAGLNDIDHVVLALPAGRMATYVLFWRACSGWCRNRNSIRRTRMAWCRAARWSVLAEGSGWC